MIAESQFHEGRQFVENPEEARTQLPGGEAAWARLRHQQAQPAFQGAARLTPEVGLDVHTVRFGRYF